VSIIRVTTQAELDAAIKDARATDTIACIGGGEFDISGSAQVRAYDSAQVKAYGSAQVRAYDSAQVTAYDSAQVTAYDSAQVTASRYVAVTRHAGRSGTPVVEGGVLIDIPRPRTADEWCEVHGVEVTDGVATLYKAVDDDYGTSYSRAAGILYAPGTTPEAPDWDGGVAECGGGLHFVARPWEGLGFNGDATRFVACPVALVDIAVHEDASMPNKIKARRVCGPIVEVDQDGKAVTA
jgi:hypothetical protein